MRLLLDTHVWVWAHLSPNRLGGHAKRLIANPLNELWLSPLTLWEAAMLHGKGRIVVRGSFENWVRGCLDELPCREAILTHEIVLEARAFSLPHADPTDRLLVATARSLGLHLLTADRLLLDSADAPTLPAA